MLNGPQEEDACLWQDLTSRSEHVTVMASVKETIPRSERRPASARSRKKGL